MLASKYEPVNRQSSEYLGESEEPFWRQQSSLNRAWKIVYVLIVLAGASLLANVFLFLKLHDTQDLLPKSYVGLEWNIPTPIPHDDRTLDDPMWDSPEIDFYTGWLSLSDEETQKKGIPSSMRWPWDATKGVYVFHAYHSLHCVHVIRNSLMEFRDNEDQTWPFGHVTHCLHTLREDVTCAADDTPRYTGHLHAQANATTFVSGIGQVRMCRDWSKLREFSLAHSACYERPLDHYVPLLDRYKHCPDGSNPWEKQEMD